MKTQDTYGVSCIQLASANLLKLGLSVGIVVQEVCWLSLLSSSSQDTGFRDAIDFVLGAICEPKGLLIFEMSRLVTS